MGIRYYDREEYRSSTRDKGDRILDLAFLAAITIPVAMFFTIGYMTCDAANRDLEKNNFPRQESTTNSEILENTISQ